MKYTLICYAPSEAETISCLGKIPKETTELKVEGVISLTENSTRYIAEKLTNLTSLDSFLNNIDARGVQNITENLTELTSLKLSANKIGNEDVQSIAEKMINLTSLNLSSNKIDDKGARYITEKMSNLTSLNLDSNQISNEGVKYIAENLTKLTSLKLSNNQISTVGAQYISEKLTKLTSLNLSNNQIGDKGAEYIAKNISTLTSLDLGSNQIRTVGAQCITENLTNLTSLNLSCNNIDDKGARYIAEKMSKLTSLDLWNSQIGDQGAQSIVENLTKLTSLNLSGNNIRDKGARYIAKKMSKLTSLDLWSSQIGDQGAQSIVENLTKLTSLNLSGNNIGDKGARYIAEKMSVLTSLNLDNNNTVGIPKIALRDINVLRLYFKTIDVEEQVLNTQVRVMLLGEPEAGKTTLFKALMGMDFTLGTEKRTHGLERGQIEFNQIDHNNFKMQDLKLDIWDMGGQSLQLMMHGFFFRTDAIYLLLINEQSSFDTIKPWLNRLKHQIHDDDANQLTIIPVFNPTKNATKKISNALIADLKSEFKNSFNWMSPVKVDLTNEHSPNVNNLKNTLRIILTSFPLKEYWQSIDDIAADLPEWQEDYFRGSHFIDKLRGRTVFKKAFMRITNKLREENPKEVFDERKFADLICDMLDLKGIITTLKNPDFVIINPAWIEKGLYSLSPPEDKMIPEDSKAAIFLQKLCTPDKDTQLPGIFSLPDIQPFWDGLGFNESHQQDLLSILCNEKLGLVIKLKGRDGHNRYFIPAYLDYVQNKTNENLLEALSEAYQKALFCTLFDNTYWPPYFIYCHMVFCGADTAYKDEHGLSFELFNYETSLSKQHYWIRSRNNPELKIEIVFYQDKFWCFAHANNGQNIEILQAELNKFKEDLYHILQQSSFTQRPDIKSLVPCPVCVSNHLIDAEQKTIDGINFYAREQLEFTQSGDKYVSCHTDRSFAHDAKISEILNHLKNTNEDHKPHSLEQAVINISLFLYVCKLALKVTSDSSGKIGLAKNSEGSKIVSIDDGTLIAMWRTNKASKKIALRLGASLIERFGYLSLLTTEQKPTIKDDYNVQYLSDISAAYLISISERISKEAEKCILELETKPYNKKRQLIKLNKTRDPHIPYHIVELEWLDKLLNSSQKSL